MTTSLTTSSPCRRPQILSASRTALTLTEGNTIDQDAIENRIRELGELYLVETIGCDPWNMARMLPRLQADGLPAIPVQQTIGSLTAATKSSRCLYSMASCATGGTPSLGGTPRT